ncbi:MAG: enoyl-CoA hydratase-related protein [Alphaproteobacteria bacterium]|nr:enoyl-CoA hydratase-related protein [Alphaproteobacteria bacterium]
MGDADRKYRVRKAAYGGGAVTEVVLSNPVKHNVFDDGLIAGLTGAFLLLAEDRETRVIILRAEGKSFSAGADLNWMKRAAEASRAENLRDAEALATMMYRINTCPKPVIGLVQGAAFGGGVGLAACCDIVVAAPAAVFALTEVKLGIIPAAISPYVVAAIGARAARRYMLTGERFDAATALQLGLVHDMVPHPDALEDRVRSFAEMLLGNGPAALAETKDLIAAVDRPWSWDVLKDTAERIARVRATDEAKEGMAAFFEKRPPDWR